MCRLFEEAGQAVGCQFSIAEPEKTDETHPRPYSSPVAHCLQRLGGHQTLKGKARQKDASSIRSRTRRFGGCGEDEELSQASGFLLSEGCS